MATELELKLAIEPQEVDSFLAFAREQGWVVANEQQMNNTYFDTPDQALKHQRVALRIRQVGDRWIQTLKTAGTLDKDGISHRGEWEWDLPGAELDLSRAQGYLPSNIQVDSLKPVFTTHFTRITWMVVDQSSSVEVALDRGEIIAAGKSVPISEVELELKSGAPQVLRQLSQLLMQKLRVQVDSCSKAQRAQRLLDQES